jgi:hypothetical protein
LALICLSSAFLGMTFGRASTLNSTQSCGFLLLPFSRLMGLQPSALELQVFF